MPFRVIKLTVLLTAFLSVIMLYGMEYYTSQPSFCGSCHIMRKPFNSWEKSKHRNVKCVECHYAPGEHHTVKAKFRGLSQTFSYFATEEEKVRQKAWINDASCTTANCHPDQKMKGEMVRFRENVIYIHKTHFDKTIEGQELHCNTCHQHVSEDKHFEVSKEACFLCHFKNTEFNKGRAKCSLCHEIPSRSLQSQKDETKPDENPVTHKSLEEAKVPCRSCHYELIQGSGEIKEEGCLGCHDTFEELEKFSDKKLMHQEHVAKHKANCFDCHRPIRHSKIQFLDPVRENCFICHPDHHKYQKLLLLGDKRKSVKEARGLMYNVKTNCIGCHVDEEIMNGEKVLRSSFKSCVVCHTPKHENMASDWKTSTDEELKSAIKIGKEALAAIENAEGKVTEKKLKDAIALYKEGQDNLNIVEFGGGIHNQKYSIKLIDDAMNHFEDAIDLLAE